jgi:hypothetical protein
MWCVRVLDAIPGAVTLELTLLQAGSTMFASAVGGSLCIRTFALKSSADIMTRNGYTVLIFWIIL